MPDERTEMLSVLHQRHAPSLLRYVIWLTGDRQLAEDVVQETLLRVWRRPELLAQHTDSVKGWLFTVARNQVIDDRRSARARHEIGVAQVREQPQTDEVDELLNAWLVSDALAQLSGNHRKVVVHAYFHGLSTAEIARTCGIPEGTVKSRLHYALQALRREMQRNGVRP